MTKHRSGILAGAVLLCMALSACSKKERVGPFERCEQIFKIIATDVSAATGMCNCIKGKSGMEGVDAFGRPAGRTDEAQEVARSCAKENGLTLPGTADAAGG